MDKNYIVNQDVSMSEISEEMRKAEDMNRGLTYRNYTDDITYSKILNNLRSFDTTTSDGQEKLFLYSTTLFFNLLIIGVKPYYAIYLVYATINHAGVFNWNTADNFASMIISVLKTSKNEIVDEINKPAIPQQPVTTSQQVQPVMNTDIHNQQPQNQIDPNPPVANKALGFDINNFIHPNWQQQQIQQNMNYVPAMGFRHQQVQQQMPTEKDIIDNNINYIRESGRFITDPAVNPNAIPLTFTDAYSETGRYEVFALEWLISPQNNELMNNFNLNNILPGAKFIHVQNDNQEYRFKFIVGSKTLYLSTAHIVDPVTNKYFYKYKIV